MISGDQDNQITQNPCIGKPSTIARWWGERPISVPALRMRQEVTWCGHVGCSPLHPSKIPLSTRDYMFRDAALQWKAMTR